MESKCKTLSIIVPCYNEEEVISIFYKECCKVLDLIHGYNFEFIFVNDGSKDKTLEKMISLAEKDDRIIYISFSRNFGKEAAILAGLENAKGDLAVLMDADLQHPPRLIPEMLKYIEEGYDSVATKRTSRIGEAKFRKYFSKKFFEFINMISDVNIVPGSTDYRMMTRQMIDSVLSVKEYHRFSKGIFEWVGYDTKWIEYISENRIAGETKWSFWGLLKYAMEGIVSFSTTPLKISSLIGLIISSLSFIYFLLTLIKTLIYGIDMPGYASTICIVTFIGGIQLIALGVIGEYLARTYIESKKRPNYFIKDTNKKN